MTIEETRLAADATSPVPLPKAAEPKVLILTWGEATFKVPRTDTGVWRKRFHAERLEVDVLARPTVALYSVQVSFFGAPGCPLSVCAFGESKTPQRAFARAVRRLLGNVALRQKYLGQDSERLKKRFLRDSAGVADRLAKTQVGLLALEQLFGPAATTKVVKAKPAKAKKSTKAVNKPAVRASKGTKRKAKP